MGFGQDTKTWTNSNYFFGLYSIHIFDSWIIESEVTLGNLPTFAFGSPHSYTYDKPIE
jgi:hypothetical protein